MLFYYVGATIDEENWVEENHVRRVKNERALSIKNGTVKYIVPVYKTEILPPNFYEQHIPKPIKTKRQKFCDGAKQKFYNVFKGSKQQTPPQSFITTSVVDNDYYELVLYFDKKKYSSIFKLRKQ